jgi:hypothetical protein
MPCYTPRSAHLCSMWVRTDCDFEQLELNVNCAACRSRAVYRTYACADIEHDDVNCRLGSDNAHMNSTAAFLILS